MPKYMVESTSVFIVLANEYDGETEAFAFDTIEAAEKWIKMTRDRWVEDNEDETIDVDEPRRVEADGISIYLVTNYYGDAPLEVPIQTLDSIG